jgi:hypothetical protein
MKYPKVNGFIGFRGDNVPLKPYPDDHAIVSAFPDLFTDDPPPGVEKPKRRTLKKAATKPVEKPAEKPGREADGTEQRPR